MQAGRRAWAAPGVAGVAVVRHLALRELSVVAVPLVVALWSLAAG